MENKNFFYDFSLHIAQSLEEFLYFKNLIDIKSSCFKNHKSQMQKAIIFFVEKWKKFDDYIAIVAIASKKLGFIKKCMKNEQIFILTPIEVDLYLNKLGLDDEDNNDFKGFILVDSKLEEIDILQFLEKEGFFYELDAWIKALNLQKSEKELKKIEKYCKFAVLLIFSKFIHRINNYEVEKLIKLEFDKDLFEEKDLFIDMAIDNHKKSIKRKIQNNHFPKFPKQNFKRQYKYCRKILKR